MKILMVKFKEWVCIPQFDFYLNGRLAIRLVDANNGEDVAMATVNVQDYDLPPNEVIVKDYSENEGMCNALVEAGLIELTGNKTQTGFVFCPIGRLNLKMLPSKIAKLIREEYECWSELNAEATNEARN